MAWDKCLSDYTVQEPSFDDVEMLLLDRLATSEIDQLVDLRRSRIIECKLALPGHNIDTVHAAVQQ